MELLQSPFDTDFGGKEIVPFQCKHVPCHGPEDLSQGESEPLSLPL